MLLAEDDTVRGFIAVADQPRSESKSVVEELNALGIHTVMLTGDNKTVAQVVAHDVGVQEVYAELLPAEKVKALQQLQARYHQVGMVGDGINDTPALAAASVGIAMGGAGSAQALETAAIALMADDLKQLPYAVRLARLARRLIVGNLILTLGTKVAVMALALAGLSTLWMAIFADVGVLLVVTLNGMRPLRMQ